MLYYWLHIIYVFICSKLFWKKVNLDANLSRTRRVSILDCEAFRFMANSKYFYYMDLIRLEIMVRTDLYKSTATKGMFGVIGSQKIIYKKPLKMWHKFKITLVLEGWDEKWVYHGQIFEQKNQICAIGITKVAFWKNKKVQNMAKILTNSGITRSEMIPSSEILNIFENDYENLKNTETLFN